MKKMLFIINPRSGREQEAKASDYVALQALQSRESELEAALEEKMERWVYLNDLAEQIAGQAGRT